MLIEIRSGKKTLYFPLFVIAFDILQILFKEEKSYTVKKSEEITEL